MMDPRGLVSSFQGFRSYLRPNSKFQRKTVNPSFWICCYIPFVLCIISAVYMWSYENSGHRLECTKGNFPPGRVFTECMQRSYTVQKNDNLNYDAPPFPGVAQTLPPKAHPNHIRNRTELPFLQPLLFFTAFAYLLPIGVWKYFLAENIVFQVTELLEDFSTAKPEDYQKEMQRRVTQAYDVMQVHVRNKMALTVALYLTKLSTPVITLAAMGFYAAVVGKEFWYYGAGVLWPTLISPALATGKSLESEVFPTHVMCTLYYVGPSGYPVNEEHTCFFPANTLYRKIFLMLWCIMITQILLTILAFFIEIVFLLMPGLRLRSLKQHLPQESHEFARQLAEKLDISGFVYVRLLMNNLSVNSFKVLLPMLNLVFQPRNDAVWSEV